MKAHIHHALDHQHSAPDRLISFRSVVIDLIWYLFSVLMPENELIIQHVHPQLIGVLSNKHLALMREMTFVTRNPDPEAILDLISGLLMAGWARHCPSLVQKLSKPQHLSSYLCRTWRSTTEW